MIKTLTPITIILFSFLFYSLELSSKDTTCSLENYEGLTFYVNHKATGTNIGTSWENAFRSLEDALAFAVRGDQIWVAKGVYYPERQVQYQIDIAYDDPRFASFELKSGVKMYGGFAGGETSIEQRRIKANKTILSGDLQKNDSQRPVIQDTKTVTNLEDNAMHVILCTNANEHTLLDGFIITAGYALHDSSIGDSNGGGMRIFGGSPRIENCTFIGNIAYLNGGGIYIDEDSDTRINNSLFIGNEVRGYSGGGISVWNAATTVSSCTFKGNEAENGAGFFSISSPNTTKLIGCNFENNHARSDGGGVYIDTNSSLTEISKSTFSGNSALYGGAIVFYGELEAILNESKIYDNFAIHGGGGIDAIIAKVDIFNTSFLRNESNDWGGGIFNEGSEIDFINCIIIGNKTTKRGGGIANSFSEGSTFINCTIMYNESFESGGGIYNSFAAQDDQSLTNCIIWGNTVNSSTDLFNSSIHLDDLSKSNISYSLIQNSNGSGNNWSTSLGTDGGNNIDQDPLLTGVLEGIENIKIGANSPILNAGNNAAISDKTDYDYLGNDRIIDEVVDLGAIEFFAATPNLDDMVFNLCESPYYFNWSTVPGAIAYQIEINLEDEIIERRLPPPPISGNFNIPQKFLGTEIGIQMAAIFEDENGAENIGQYSEAITISTDCLEGRSTQIMEEFSVNIFPNPTSKELTVVSNSELSKESYYSILDILGKEVLRNPISLAEGKNINTIDLRSLSSGTYFLRLEGNTAIKFTKID